MEEAYAALDVPALDEAGHVPPNGGAAALLAQVTYDLMARARRLSRVVHAAAAAAKAQYDTAVECEGINKAGIIGAGTPEADIAQARYAELNCDAFP